MKQTKYKHLSFENRCLIQEYLDYGYSFSGIAKCLGKDRTTVSKEILKHRFIRKRSDSRLDVICPSLAKPPYVCNGCPNKSSCHKVKYQYEASVAYNEYLNSLSTLRSYFRITKNQIASINEVISPLMIHFHHSVNHVYCSHKEILPFSKSTFYRYIDLGLLNVRNLDLQRKVRYKVKKEYEHRQAKIDPSTKVGRFYSDFTDYLEFHPDASIVEMDTVLGTQGGKGGKCFLTLYFRKFHLMLIYLLPYKKSQYVTEIFLLLKNSLGTDIFQSLFQVILTDNGTEFSDPNSIERDSLTGDPFVSLFYCDPYSSWQKASIEKNHEYIRYILPKGSSFSGLTQEDTYLLASHINSTPRVSLNNHSPYEIALPFLGEKIMNQFHITKIDYDQINLSPRLLKK